ncbi:tRNA (guanosine(46)-N7)-methyltransferase TrmB [Chitinivibrio alkaliphilus]|uniref:tRNA (guanine-N(7)-)-methyltransferase n=1 Tax=Chitinivibrio alkaliphilus ACht1 TaxID=1313304 RepID=U7D7H9_9BACT|nr:tRNA (guanosine(46)-N7)-methyltransferase TrmB [Chitinivibrio alkaliphilus]ERP31536.1 tRNA (guanine-N(7)-)-methyltransferase [Chitinivibrio alkaliphilus ACht1]
MRQRNIKHAPDVLAQHPTLVCMNPDTTFHAPSFFPQSGPLHLEIGSGKGAFLAGMAHRFPHINFLGMERFDSILIRCLEKTLALALPNLRFIKMDARNLTDVFAPGQIDTIYLNFSDPWHKKRHAKRRLTHTRFLSRYKEVLSPKGELIFKTDNRPLFEFSLLEMHRFGMTLDEICLDLHAQEPEDNIRTEYEEKWSARGSTIYRLKGCFRK